MFSTHVLLIVIACVTGFAHGGGDKRGKVCRYSSDGPVCRTDIECSEPEVHCYRRPGNRYGRCCVKRQYACLRGANRYDDPEGFPPLVRRCPRIFPFVCSSGYNCRTTTDGPTKYFGVCCPIWIGWNYNMNNNTDKKTECHYTCSPCPNGYFRNKYHCL